MPPNPISSMMTLVIPLFFTLALVTAAPVGAGPYAMGEPVVWSAGAVAGEPPRWSGGTVPPAWSAEAAAGGPLESNAAAVPAVRSTDAAARGPLPSNAEAVPSGPPTSNTEAVPPASSTYPVAVRPRAWSAGAVGPVSNAEGVVGACTGSFCGLVRPAPLRLSPTGEGDGGLLRRGLDLLGGVGFGAGESLFPMTPLDPEFCEYVGPAPFFMSPSDSEFCGLISPAPLSLPSVTA